MKAEARLPGFSSIICKEDSILHDHFCYNSLLSFDLSFTTQKIYFSLDSALKSSSFETGCSAEFYHQGFTSTFALCKKVPSFTLKFPSRKFTFCELFGWPFNKNSFIRPSLQLKVSSMESKLKPDFSLCAALVNENMKSKLKLTSKRLSGNITFGSGVLGFGLRGGMNIADLSPNNYSIAAWFLEELNSIKVIFNGNWNQPERNRLSGYFLYKVFDHVDFVAKLTLDGAKSHNLLIGCQGKVFEKGLWKARGCNKGKIALGFSNKILPRTKIRVSALFNTFDLEQSKFGCYFNFHAKDAATELNKE